MDANVLLGNNKRIPKIHDLKIAPEYFGAVIRNEKTFEIRKDDRDYCVGDWVKLKEYQDGEFTGASTCFQISYILRDCPQYGLMEGYCILCW